MKVTPTASQQPICAKKRALPKAVVPDSKGGKVRLAFTDGSKWDTGGMRYYATGDSAAVAGGQVIADVTPNCVATTKQ